MNAVARGMFMTLALLIWIAALAFGLLNCAGENCMR